MFNVVVSKVIVTRFKLQKCLIAAFRANINRESQKFYTIAEKKKESIRSSAMERTKKNECIRSSTIKQTKKNEGFHSSTIDVLPLLLMIECTPESSGCYSVYSVHITMFINSTARHRLRGEGSEGRFSETKDDARELPENAQ